MAYKISDDCTACGSCMDSCPAEAIKEGEKYSIDADTCIDCDLCTDECPTKAIFSDDELPEKWQSFIEKNAAYYQ